MVLPPAEAKLHRIELEKFTAELSAQQPIMRPTKAVDKIEIKWVSEAKTEAVRIAELVGKQEVNEEIDATTDHAWLVVLGHFAQALKLVTGLAEVPLEQRKGPDETKPQTKLVEFLVGILGGIEYLQDLNKGSEPIVKDQSIAAAWGQAIFRHYSQVSRTLEVADEETLAAVVEVLRRVSAPFIQAAVMEEVKQKGRLMIDVDLTGRVVSPSSSDYDDATFGWMDDGVSKGYQDALTCLVSERWQRLMLTLQRYSGRTLSAECLQAAFPAVESWPRLIFSQSTMPDLAAASSASVRRLEPADSYHLWGLGPEVAWISKTWGGANGLAASGLAWGAFVAGQLAAVACTFFLGQTYEEIGVVTEPKFRGRGLSTACSRALCRDIHTRGHRPSWTTSPDNTASLRVAEKLGFTRVRDDLLYVVGVSIPDSAEVPPGELN